MKTHCLIILSILLITGALLLGNGAALCDETYVNPQYKEPVTITSLKLASISPFMKLTGLHRGGDSSVASDQLAVTDNQLVTVYSLKTREKIFSAQYSAQDAGGEGTHLRTELPCRLSPDGKRIALILRNAQKVDIIEISTGKVRSVAIAEPELIEWSDMGEYLLVVGNRQKLNLIPLDPGKKSRVFDLIPPGGIPPEFKDDYGVDYVHLMPDNRTLYFKSAFTITSCIYGMDLETPAIHQLRYAESVTIRFSSTSQYLYEVYYEHPGDGYMHIGPVTASTAGDLSKKEIVSAYTMRPVPAFSALGPWCAFSNDMVRASLSDEAQSSIELLLTTENRLFRLITEPSDEVWRLFFTWSRQLLVVDMNTGDGRVISVMDPRSLIPQK